VEVRIGVKGAPREIQQIVEKALRSEDPALTLVDEKGRRVIVAMDKLAYVEIADVDSRRVGFGAL
jgi:hypothetical protein